MSACIICGKDFQPGRKNQKTCLAPACRKGNMDRHHRRNNARVAAMVVPQRTCVVCGKDLPRGVRGGRKYCGNPCKPRSLAGVELRPAADRLGIATNELIDVLADMLAGLALRPGDLPRLRLSLSDQ